MNTVLIALLYVGCIFGFAAWSGVRLRGPLSFIHFLGATWFFLFGGTGLLVFLEEGDKTLLIFSCINQAATLIFLLCNGVGRFDLGKYWIRSNSEKNFFVWFFLSIVVGILSVIGSSLLLQLLQHFGVTHQQQELMKFLQEDMLIQSATILLVIVLAPITEELLFRGTIQPLIQHKTSVWFSIIVTGILFGAMHFDSLTAVPPLIIFGIVLGWWKEKTGWILFPIIAHLTNNILVVFVQ